MKSFLLSVGAFALTSVSARTFMIPRNASSKSFMGGNLYFLQGLSDDAQDAYIEDLANHGAKVVRVWVNEQPGDNTCVKGSKITQKVPALETTLGEYNSDTLDALDVVINKLAQKGIKSLISPHDGNSLLGDYRKDVYFDKWGAKSFYTDSDALDAYKKRIDYIFNYQGKTSGKVWKNWGDAIMAFDLQNEPMSADNSVCTGGDTGKWLCQTAQHMRETLGADNPIKIATGGIGGDDSHGCTTLSAATQCDQIDLIAAHKYAGKQSSNPSQWSNSASNWISKSNGKLVFVEEWGVNTGSSDPTTELAAEADDINSVAVPNLYWQFLPKQDSGCSYDPKNDSGDKFGIYVESDTDIAAVMKQSSDADAKQDWSGIIA
ncbi:Uu.00g000680.m01.CDS01 [Anthostomella pinea]|uniref:mannan endo-1,4-beta-mannosidase n=1 Tax=Anthostomella pinea TaxID=933095 RepID=A0AAI8YG15_9PEZI|nr:Uu.00g000680.m01.CDS01 [Anthostomella pinea]